MWKSVQEKRTENKDLPSHLMQSVLFQFKIPLVLAHVNYTGSFETDY